MTSAGNPISVGGRAALQAACRFMLFACGFGERSLEVLKMVVARYGDARFGYEFAALDDADIFLVNGNIPDVASVVKRIRERRHCPALVLSVQSHEDIPDIYWLPTPLAPQAFINTLNTMASRLLESAKVHDDLPGQAALAREQPLPRAAAESKTAATADAADAARPAGPSYVRRNAAHAANLLEQDLSPEHRSQLHNIDLNDQEQFNRIYFNPEGFLCQHLTDALRAMKGEARILEVVVNGEFLILDFARNRWGGQFDEQALRKLCLTPLYSPPSVRFLAQWPEKAQFQGSPELIPAQTGFSTDQGVIRSHRTFRAEFIAAQIGLWCAHGRLPSGVDLHRPVRLRHWPDIMCLPRTHGALQIAALWMQAHCSLVQTVQRTGLLQSHVFAFYVICDTLNLLDNDSPPAVAVAKPEPRHDPKPSAAPGGFLRRLMNAIWRPGSND